MQLFMKLELRTKVPLQQEANFGQLFFFSGEWQGGVRNVQLAETLTVIAGGRDCREEGYSPIELGSRRAERLLWPCSQASQWQVSYWIRIRNFGAKFLRCTTFQIATLVSPGLGARIPDCPTGYAVPGDFISVDTFCRAFRPGGYLAYGVILCVDGVKLDFHLEVDQSRPSAQARLLFAVSFNGNSLS